MAEIRLSGRPASSGFAEGQLYVLPDKRVSRAPTGDPDLEAKALRNAIILASEALADLATTADGDAADMLGFQVAMLEDDALSEMAFAAIAEGKPADIAWRHSMDQEIEAYRSADDEYFRARSADLEDIRDNVLDMLSGGTSAAPPPPGAILIARDLQPSRFLGIDWSKGGAILLSEGSPTSHVAMLARARGVPMIVGLGELPRSADGIALIDGGSGQAILSPERQSLDQFITRRAEDDNLSARAEKLLLKDAMTKTGEAVTILINVADPLELDVISPDLCDGIGLVRTEFLFSEDGSFPDEEAQYRVYRRLVEWASGRPVTIRTLDAGGDKPIKNLTIDGESNPFLGVRGIRLSLIRTDLFRIQLRALSRAASHGPIKIMAPMVTIPSELATVRRMMAEEFEGLKAKGIAAALPPIGIMVEVPAAALAMDLFDADFFSIGSNDLTQYVTAAGRDIGSVADLADPRHPAVLRLIAMIATQGKKMQREVSLCGDAGGDPALIPLLLHAGIRCLSMAPSMVARAKLIISETSLSGDVVTP
ncbi:MAG: phosphoenolpyruvate--protein phosphotransferase [Beijerinckiaceae bacterium]|nr:phosphoenolpyruvate--protein phosphotransferase [Beijerinckiaceae bacterium]